jgi:hypothetical protein
MNIIDRLENTGDGIYELVMEGEELSLQELMALNRAGYIHVKSSTDIDYEDEDENGKTVTRYMDIHYFGRVNVKQFSELLDL